MARGARDDEEREGRTETLIEKSDRLAREYSREREIRQRTDRVRRIDPAGTDTKLRPRPGARPDTSLADALPEEGTQVAAPPSAPPPAARREAPERPSTREREAAARDPTRPREPPAREAREAPAAAKEAKKPRVRTADRPAATQSAAPQAAKSQLPKERAEPLPSSPPVAPKPVPPPARGALDQLAVELEELLRELRFGWRGLPASDRVTSLCSVSVIAGVLMPWVSDPAHSLRVGLLSGGVLHLAIALVSLFLVSRSSALRGLRMTKRDELAQHRRISLWLVLLGAASTVAGAYLLLLYGVSKSADWPVQLHFGLYWTLVSGTGLSYGGFARFSDVRS